MDPVLAAGDASGATPAAQPAATESSNPLARLSSDERRAWDLDGSLPAHITGDKPAAKPAEGDDAPAVDAKGAPITEGGRALSKREQRQRETIQRGISDGIRVAQERAERAERELADLRRGAQPAAQPQTQTAKPAEDREPVLDDFLDQPDPFLAYNRAIGKWDRAQERKAELADRQTQTHAQQQHEGLIARVTAHTARQEAIKATVPDYDAKTQTVREQLDLRSPLALAVVESDVSEHLILHLAEHPEDFERIGLLGMSNMPAALREIGRLESKFIPSGAQASGAAPAVETKLVSTAPKPPTTLGTRSADPADASRSAVARNDVRAFIESEDRKDLARMGRR